MLLCVHYAYSVLSAHANGFITFGIRIKKAKIIGTGKSKQSKSGRMWFSLYFFFFSLSLFIVRYFLIHLKQLYWFICRCWNTHNTVYEYRTNLLLKWKIVCYLMFSLNTHISCVVYTVMYTRNVIRAFNQLKNITIVSLVSVYPFVYWFWCAWTETYRLTNDNFQIFAYTPFPFFSFF